MKYQELRRDGETVASSAKIEVVELDGVAYKLFDKSFSPTQIFYEAMVQTMAGETGIRVPKIYGIQQIDDRLAILSEYIDGKTVAQLMEEYPAKKDHYLSLLADTQISIHAHTVADIRKMKNRLAGEIEGLSVLDEVKKYELKTRLASMPEHNKLCHGNFGPDNVVIDGMDKIVVLDWVAAASGNATADIAKSYIKLSLTSTELAERYITVICEKAGIDRQYVYEWLPLMAACGLCAKNPTEKEKAVLYSWLDVADNS